jgi:hypothetical protein
MVTCESDSDAYEIIINLFYDDMIVIIVIIVIIIIIIIIIIITALQPFVGPWPLFQLLAPIRSH